MTSVIDIRPSIDPIPLVRALAGLEVQGFYGRGRHPHAARHRRPGDLGRDRFLR